MKTLPFKYENIFPEDRYLLQSKNPPNVKIKFYKNIKNLREINCYSNEGNKWRNSKLNFVDDQILNIKISEKFVGERGRINCSLRETEGFWRWLGIQYVISEINYEFNSTCFTEFTNLTNSKSIKLFCLII